MPWVHSISSSSVTGRCASRACSVATSGHSTTSPSTVTGPESPPIDPVRSVRSLPGGGGRSSSMGKARTSVGPSSPIQRWCRSAIVGPSTSNTDSSANGWIRISSSTYRASAARAGSSTLTPDSLRISMLMRAARSLGPLAGSPGPRPAIAALGGPATQAAVPHRAVHAGPCLVGGVGVHDVPDKPVPDHVMTGQPGELDVFDAFEYLLHQPQPAGLAGRQVHLGDVAGDHHPGTEAKPGEEHLHLLGRGVLRLVQDDERIIQRPPAHIGERRDLD